MKNKYKRKLIWCSSCDANHAQPGCKCSNCGNREYGVKHKKPNMQEILNLDKSSDAVGELKP